MAKNEVGEFELVLGNKQLLSVFFIVVVLLGVFFTMGYIVGRNSGSTATIEAGNRKPTIVDSPAAPSPTPIPAATEPEPKKEEAPAPAPAGTSKADEKAAAAKEKEEARRAEVQRLADEKIAEEEKKTQAKKADDKKADDKKKAKPAEAPAAPRPASGSLSGTYLQLAAVPRAEADLLISVLQKKGFSAAAGPGPEGSNLFRVLVGPLAGTDAISQTRNSLNEAGMPGSKAIVKRF